VIETESNSTKTVTPFTMTTRGASKRYNVSARTLNHWRATGMPYLLPGPRKVLFVVEEADAWVLKKFAIGRTKPTLARIASAGVVL
jgi:hypothetical protein